MARLRSGVLRALPGRPGVWRWLSGGQPGDRDASRVAQLFCGRVEGLLDRQGPESQLVATAMTLEAVPHVATEIGSKARSALRWLRSRSPGTQHANAAEALSAALHRLKSEQFQNPRDWNQATDRSIVEAAMSGGARAIRWPVAVTRFYRCHRCHRCHRVDCGDVVAFAGIARAARYDLPTIFNSTALSTTRSSSAIANGASPR